MFTAWFENEQGIPTCGKVLVGLLEFLVKSSRHPAKSAYGRCWVEGPHVNQLYFAGAEDLRAAKNLGYVESRLEIVQHDNKIVDTW